MTTWAPVRYAHNGDVAIAYSTGGQGEIDVLLIGGFVGHLEISPTLPAAAHADRVTALVQFGASTEPGGTRMREHGLRIEVSGGLAAAWATTSYWGDAMVGDVDAFCASAGAALRELSMERN